MKHLDPLEKSIPVCLPDMHRGLHRLPWTFAAGPAQPAPLTCWERRMCRDWQLWTEDWHRHGFPDDLSESICAEVHTALTAEALQWTPNDDLSLSLRWCNVVDGFTVHGAKLIIMPFGPLLCGGASVSMTCRNRSKTLTSFPPSKLNISAC